MSARLGAERPRGIQLTFGEDAAAYDRTRPVAPGHVFDELARLRPWVVEIRARDGPTSSGGTSKEDSVAVGADQIDRPSTRPNP